MPAPRTSSGPRAASGLAVGSVVSGVLAYVFFAASTRVLGAAEAAPVAVLWSYWGFAAAGLTFPVQHWITHVAATGGEDAVRAAWAVPGRLVGGVVAATTGAAWIAREALFGGDGRFVVLTALVGVGAAGMGVVRGLLGARRRYVALGALLVLENLVRCAAAVGLVVLDVHDPAAYGAALVIGYAACAVWASAWRTRRSTAASLTGRTGSATGGATFLGGAAGAQVLAQAVLTGGPVLLAVLGGAPTQVTVLFAALALYRAPYTVLVGQVSQITGPLTQLVAARQADRLLHVDRALLIATALGVVIGAGVGAGPGPWLVELVFGEDVRVARGVSIALAAGSVLALATLVQGVVLLAHGRPQHTLAAWGLALVPAAGVVVAAPGSPTTTIAVAFVVAHASAFLVLAAASRAARAGLRRA